MDVLDQDVRLIPYTDHYRFSAKVFRQAVVQGLLALGYEEGKTIHVEYRAAQGNGERLPALVQELIRVPVDVLLVTDTAALQAASQATRTIPIVALFAGDPLASGVVASLARPGGNVTGPSDFASEVAAKRLEILTHAVPTSHHVGVFWNTTLPDRALAWQRTAAAARTLGLQISSFGVQQWGELSAAFSAARTAAIDAFVVLSDALLVSATENLVAFQSTAGVPGGSEGRNWAVSGGLLTYGADELELARQTAGYIVRILHGAQPATLPIRQPTQFELILNLRTAGKLGLTIPEAVLTQATEVIPDEPEPDRSFG